MTKQLHFHFSLSCIGEGDGNPLQCSCLEDPRDRGAQWSAVYGVAQSRTQLKRLSSNSSSNPSLAFREDFPLYHCSGFLGFLIAWWLPRRLNGKESAWQCRRHETWIQSLGQKYPLEEEMATHPSVLAWKIPWTEKPGGLQFMGSQRFGHD